MSYHCNISAIRPDLIKGEMSGPSAWYLAQLKEMKDELYYPHRYKSLAEFFERHNLPHPKGYWRLTEYRLGHFNGCPMTYGRLCATNGMTAYILRTDDSLVSGLMPNFIADDELEAMEKIRAPKSASRQAGQHISPKMSELFDINF